MRVPATAQITRIGAAAGLSGHDRTSMQTGGYTREPSPAARLRSAIGAISPDERARQRRERGAAPFPAAVTGVALSSV
jgi:hypothetical protein